MRNSTVSSNLSSTLDGSEFNSSIIDSLPPLFAGHTWSKTLLDPDLIKFGEEILYEQFLNAPIGPPHFTSPSRTHNICWSHPSWIILKCPLRSSQLRKSFLHSSHLLMTPFMNNSKWSLRSLLLMSSSPHPSHLVKSSFMNNSNVIFRVLSSSQVLSALITVVEFSRMSTENMLLPPKK